MSEGTGIPEISPEELLRDIESGSSIQILDVRTPERLESGTIDIVPRDRFFNAPGSLVMATPDPLAFGLDPETPVAVVCNTGRSSVPVAMFLKEMGFEAQSVRGGMAAWMSLAVERELPAPSGFDLFYQFNRIGKGSVGYVLISDGEALVVDPPRKFHAYLQCIERAGAKVVGVADTHCHADYISGAPALAERCSAPYYLHDMDNLYPYDGTPGKLDNTHVESGTEIRVGRGAVRARHNPGHTEGSVSFEVRDEAALTGDFIFVNSIGRPDLAGKTEEWTKDLWSSLVTARADWPDSLSIMPAHYASHDEIGNDKTVRATVSELKQRNKAFNIQDENEFAEWIMTRLTAPPAMYRTIKGVNVQLIDVDEAQADELEHGKNQCAVG